MFSQEQIKEIQYKLGLLGMKDTAFPVVSNLNASDTITLVQDAVNKRANIKQLAEAIPTYNPDIMTGTKDRDVYIFGLHKNYTYGKQSISKEEIEDLLDAYRNHKFLAIKILEDIYPLTIDEMANPEYSFTIVNGIYQYDDPANHRYQFFYTTVYIDEENQYLEILRDQINSEDYLDGFYLKVSAFNTAMDNITDNIEDLKRSKKLFCDTDFSANHHYQIPSQYIDEMVVDITNEITYYISIDNHLYPFYPTIYRDEANMFHFTFFIVQDVTSDYISGIQCTYNNQDEFGIVFSQIPLASGSGITEIPMATSSALGGICVGFTQTGKKYPVKLSNKKAYVEVPWENTTYTFTPTNPTLSWGNTSVIGKVDSLEFKVTMPTNPFPYTLGYTQSGKNYPVLQSNNKLYVNVPWTDNNTTYTKATTAKDGLMSKEDKAKLDTYNPTLYTLKKTQAEYNALESAGTLDANTIYFIVG